MKQILLPLDFEKVSDNILKFTFSLARVVDADVTILNVTDGKKISDVNFAPLSERIERMIKEKELQDVHYQFVLKKGVPEKEIIVYAENNNVLITVMETRSKEEKQQELIGSITAEVVDSGKIPVLEIPRDYNVSDFNDFKSVGVAESLTEYADQSYDKILQFIPNHIIELNIVHILERNENVESCQAIINDIDAYIHKNHPKVKVSFSIIPFEKSLSTDLINFFSTSTFDLLVVRNSKRNLISRLFKSSLAKKLAYHAKTPMVVLPFNESVINKFKSLH